MMNRNQLQVLKETELCGQQFAVYGTPEEPLFLATDVAAWIEHSNVSEMLRSVDDDEKLTSVILRAGQNRECNFLTEDGLYEVLMQSRKPIAKQFKKGVKKILHEVRTKGRFTAQPQQQLTLTDKIKAASWAAKFLNLNENSKLILAKQILDPLGLPTPDYTTSKGVLKSATELLKENGSSLTIREFNALMIKHGYLADMTRKAANGKIKHFKAFTHKGKQFGENQVSPKQPNQTQPMYYADGFARLLNTVA